MRFWTPILLLFLLANCATYWKNRRKDMQDVVTVGGETPMYGAAIKLGPLPIGFLFQGGESEMGKRDLGRGYGLRGGNFGGYHSQQLVFGILGGESHHSGLPMLDDKGNWIVDKKGIPLTEDERANLKSYKMRYYSYFNDPVGERKKRKKETFQRELTLDIVNQTGNKDLMMYLPKGEEKPFGYPKGFLWNIEFVGGIYGGARVGFNIAEALDFVLGFTTFDMFDDDLEGKEKPSFPGFPLPANSESEEDDSSED